MTIKLPPRGQRSGPIYQAIADQIGSEIEAGRLKPGGRLPTQRSLARQLGVTLTTGGQHAILLSLMAIAKPGDEILLEEFTYPGISDLADHLQLKLRKLPLDSEGLRPDALDEACRKRKPAALYCMPSFQNPTATL